MLLFAARLPIGAMTFVVESETLYVRVQKGFRPATVGELLTTRKFEFTLNK